MKEPTFKIGDLVRLISSIDDTGRVLTVVDVASAPGRRRLICLVHPAPLELQTFSGVSWVSETCLELRLRAACGRQPRRRGGLPVISAGVSWLGAHPDPTNRDRLKPHLSCLIKKQGAAATGQRQKSDKSRAT